MITSIMRNISFSRKPIPIPAEYRPTYKIAQIVLILKLTCQSEKGSLLKLHLMSWALKSEKNREKLLGYVHSNFTSDLKIWSIEPALNRALLYAIGEKLCRIENGKYVLTDGGNYLYKQIVKNDDLLGSEIKFLNQIGKRKITDRRIIALSKKWESINYKWLG